MTSKDSKTSTWRTRTASTAGFLGNVLMAAMDPHYGLCSECRVHAQRIDTIKGGLDYLYTLLDTAPDEHAWVIRDGISAAREEMARKQNAIDVHCRVGA